MVDRETLRSRGFGFVTFARKVDCDKIVNFQGDHVVNGKVVECKKAVPKMNMHQPHQQHQRQYQHPQNQVSANYSSIVHTNDWCTLP